MSKPRRRTAGVWDTGRVSIRTQLADRYVGTTHGDTAALSPAIARRIIATYTRAGDTVLDPQPGAGIVLAEAVRSGRNAIGIVSAQRWLSACEANLDLARLTGSAATARLFDGVADPRAAELPGAIDLVLTGIRQTPARDPERALPNLYDTLATVSGWVWPGGRIVIVCRPWRQGSRLVDLPGRVRETVEGLGFRSSDHCVALTAPLRDGTVRLRNSQVAAGRLQNTPRIAITAHLDVLVFTAPFSTDNDCAAGGGEFHRKPEAAAA